MSRSHIWSFFTKKGMDKAQCNGCNKLFKFKNCSTSSLWYHLKTANNSCGLLISREKTLSNMFKPCIGYCLSKILVEDNVPIHRMHKSNILADFLTKNGHKMPSSKTSISDKVIEFYNIHKTKLTIKIKSLLESGVRFNLSVDEWSSPVLHRYLSVILYYGDKNINLGLKLISGELSGENVHYQIKEFLVEFGLSLTNHILSQTFDGASYMLTYGKFANIPQIICINHTLHLSVLKCLEVYDVEEKDINKVSLVKKVRSIVHTFKKSPKLSQYLEEYLAREAPELKLRKLIMDCKVRWNSLFKMLERFVKLYSHIKQVYSELNKEFNINEAELHTLKTICIGLQSVEECVLMFSSEKCTFIDANLAVIYLIDYLWSVNDIFSQNLSLCIKNYHKIRINKALLSSIMYIHKAETFDFYCSEMDHKKYLIDVFKRLYPDQILKRTDAPTSVIKDDIETTSFSEGLSQFLSSSKTKLECGQSTLSDILGMQNSPSISMFQKALDSIKPTSTSNERTFSYTGSVCVPNRSSMSDDLLIAIVFLRYNVLIKA